MTLALEMEAPKKTITPEARERMAAAHAAKMAGRELGKIEFENWVVAPYDDGYWTVQEVKDGKEGDYRYFPTLDYAVLDVLNQSIHAKTANGARAIIETIKEARAEILAALWAKGENP